MSSTLPLVRLSRLHKSGRLAMKAEHFGATGCVYDRVASTLAPDGPMVVAASGSTCLAFAAVAARGHRKLFCIHPEDVLLEHRVLFQKHDLERVAVEGGLEAMEREARARADAHEAKVVLSPAVVEDAAEAFRATLGVELLARVGAGVGVFVPSENAALVLGLSRALAGSGARVFGVTAADPAVGLASDAVIPSWPESVTRVPVSAADAMGMWRRLGREEGVLVGHGSAAAAHAALDALLSDELERAIFISADAGDRYLSTMS